MRTSEELRSSLRSIDRRSYPAYKSLAGSWSFGRYVLNIEHVQGDPFAAPSQLSVTVDGRTAGFPAAFWEALRASGGALLPSGEGVREERRAGRDRAGTGGLGADRLRGAGRGGYAAL